MSNEARKATALVENPRPGPDTPLAHRRPGDPLTGCFPAEPASVSPSVAIPSENRVGLQPLDIGVMPEKSTAEISTRLLRIAFPHDPPKIPDEPDF
jgi:hypothetical protein